MSHIVVSPVRIHFIAQRPLDLMVGTISRAPIPVSGVSLRVPSPRDDEGVQLSFGFKLRTFTCFLVSPRFKVFLYTSVYLNAREILWQIRRIELQSHAR